MAMALDRNAPIMEMRSPGPIGFPLLLFWKNGRYFSEKLRPSSNMFGKLRVPTLNNPRGHVSTKMAELLQKRMPEWRKSPPFRLHATHVAWVHLWLELRSEAQAHLQPDYFLSGASALSANWTVFRQLAGTTANLVQTGRGSRCGNV